MGGGAAVAGGSVGSAVSVMGAGRVELVDCELRTCGIGMSVDDAGMKIHK